MFKKNSKNTIFIGGLPGSTTQESLKTYFERFGEILKVSTVQNTKKNNLSKGYALITYKEDESYNQALKVPEHYLFKRVISCQPYLQGAQLSQYLEDLNSRRLFVKYIPKNINNKQFEKIFKKYGEVDFGYVVKDPKSSVSRGFGYITFKTQEIAREVEKMRFVKIKNNRKLKIFPYKRRGIDEEETKKKSADIVVPRKTKKIALNPNAAPVIKTKRGSLITDLGQPEQVICLVPPPQVSSNLEVKQYKDYSIKPSSSQWFKNFTAQSEQNNSAYPKYAHYLGNLEFNKGRAPSRLDKLEYCRQLAQEEAEEDLPEFLKMSFILPAME